MSLAHNAGLHTVGVEEELLIVDPAKGRPLPLAGELPACWRGPCRFQSQAFHQGVCAFHDLVEAWLLCAVTWPWAVIRARLQTPEWHGWAAGKAQGGIPRGCSGTAQGA